MSRARGRLLEQLEASEGALLSSLPWRLRVVWVVAFPMRAVLYGWWKFCRWSAWPGDVFVSPVEDTVYVLTEVKPDYVTAAPVARRILVEIGRPQRVLIIRERVDREGAMDDWRPLGGPLAERARELVDA